MGQAASVRTLHDRPHQGSVDGQPVYAATCKLHYHGITSYLGRVKVENLVWNNLCDSLLQDTLLWDNLSQDSIMWDNLVPCSCGISSGMACYRTSSRETTCGRVVCHGMNE